MRPPALKSSWSVPILAYHSLDESGSVLSIAPRLFRAQMDYLKRAGWCSMRLRDVVEGLKTRVLLPEHTVALTFDDGFENIYTHAFPVLQDMGFTATIFVVSDYCGKNNEWPSQPCGLIRSRLLDWEQVQDMCSHGMDIGSHSVAHASLRNLSPAAVECEIRESKARIEDRIGRAVEMFAYPYGQHSASVRHVVRQWYAGACSTRLGYASARSDPYALERVEMYYLRRMDLFEGLGTRWLGGYLACRRLGRAVKAWRAPR